MGVGEEERGVAWSVLVFDERKLQVGRQYSHHHKSPKTLSRRSGLPDDSVGKTEEAREKCECGERAGMKRPKHFFFKKKWGEKESKKRGRGSKYVFASMRAV